LVIGYALLGAGWLIWKTEGAPQERARKTATTLGAATLLALIAVSAATPFLIHEYWRRWFEVPGIVLTAPVPLLVAVTAYLYFRALRRRDERSPFLLALVIFLLGFVGL